MATPAELEYFYHGFHRALQRYRSATMIGWVIVLAGVACIPLGWRTAGAHGLLDLAVCGAAIVAGLVVVSESVSFLHAYISVPFPVAGDADAGRSAPVEDLRALMQEIDKGGWQEAYAAVRLLRVLGERHGLPPPGEPPNNS
jgi:hypothetical protein